MSNLTADTTTTTDAAVDAPEATPLTVLGLLTKSALKGVGAATAAKILDEAEIGHDVEATDEQVKRADKAAKGKAKAGLTGKALGHWVLTGKSKPVAKPVAADSGSTPKAAPKARANSPYSDEVRAAVKIAKEARGTSNGAPGPKQHDAIRKAITAEIDGDVTAASVLKWLGISQTALLNAANGSMPTTELRGLDTFRKVQALDALQDPKIRPWIGGRNGASILVAWVTQLKAR
jgi:hypothetical protein